MERVTNGKQLGLASRRYVGGCSRAYTPLGNGGFFYQIFNPYRMRYGISSSLAGLLCG